MAGSAFFGVPGAFAGSVIGAGVGQLTNNAQDGRPLTEGLLASMCGCGRLWREYTGSPPGWQFISPRLAG